MDFEPFFSSLRGAVENLSAITFDLTVILVDDFNADFDLCCASNYNT